MTGSDNVSRRGIVFLVWGVMDAVSIAWYILSSWHGGRVPYISDVVSALMFLEDQGGIAFFIVVTSWLLHFSIILSCVLFLYEVRCARLLAYAQVPFRLFFLLPSIPVILISANLLPGLNYLWLVLMFLSEMLKVWTLWRYS